MPVLNFLFEFNPGISLEVSQQKMLLIPTRPEFAYDYFKTYLRAFFFIAISK